MKIKITKHIPVETRLRPAIGSIHEVIRPQVGRSSVGTPNIILVNGTEVGVWNTECEKVSKEEEINEVPDG